MSRNNLYKGYWEFRFEAPVGHRLMRYGMWVAIYDCNYIWYDLYHNKWIDMRTENIYGHLSNTSKPVKTFRAFKRHLRKNHDILKDHEVVWCSRYFNHDVYARWIPPIEILK